MSGDPMPTINAVVHALAVMRDKPPAISLSRRTVACMSDESKWLGMRHDPSYTHKGNSIAGVKFSTSARDDEEPNTIDIRDLDGALLMRVAADV